jgi:hypothetical protein
MISAPVAQWIERWASNPVFFVSFFREGEVWTISGSSDTKGSFRSPFPGLKLSLTGLEHFFILLQDSWMGFRRPESCTSAEEVARKRLAG